MRPSTGEYPDDWNLIALVIKQRTGWNCIRCGHPHDTESGHMLTVHHLDLNKSNCEWWNLVALCQKCHLSVQARVVMERAWLFEHTEWIQPYVAGYYASVHGLSTNREFVEHNQSWLLELGRKRAS